MLIHTDASRKHPSRPPTTRTWLALILIVAAIVFVGVAYGSQLKERVWSWAVVDLAYNEALSRTGRLRTDAPIALSNWMAATLSSDADLPTVALDIKFRHLMRLRSQRDQALALGLLVQGEDDYVPATMRLDDRAIRVEVRLKGDMTDQLEHGRWAFRIHVKDGDHLIVYPEIVAG